MAESTATTRPLPGPVMVTWDPPKMATITPPTIAAITPDMGGAPEAMAKPKPKGKAIKETTKPENILEGKSFTKVEFFNGLI